MLRLQAPLPERYTAATDDELAAMIGDAKAALGSRLFILGHHYQRDDVMRWADARGDSFGLSRIAAGQEDAEYIVFCGVHFMAESADVLTGDHQQVMLPDLNAGCSMADMADIDQVEAAWSEIAEVTDVERVVPITYMNSTAALKAFCGRHGGAVCTSSNARRVLEWALDDQPDRPGADKVLFFPDQHLGRNTAIAMGYDPTTMLVWDPRREQGGLEDVEIKQATASVPLLSAVGNSFTTMWQVTDEEVVGVLFLMVVAGNETTTKLLGNAWYWAWRNPDERAKPLSDPTRIPDWVEETLRFDPRLDPSRRYCRPWTPQVLANARSI